MAVRKAAPKSSIVCPRVFLPVPPDRKQLDSSWIALYHENSPINLHRFQDSLLNGKNMHIKASKHIL
jgi:hypothetical protein